MIAHVDQPRIHQAIDATTGLPGFIAGYTCAEINNILREHSYNTGRGYDVLTDRGRERLREIIAYCEEFPRGK